MFKNLLFSVFSGRPRKIHEKMNWRAKWVITRYASDADYLAGNAYNQSEVNFNLLLNEGIGEIWDLVCSLGTPTAFSNANARLGVGDSAAAEAATQTDLQAAVNKTYKAMEASYPSRAAQTVTFRSVFGSADANYAWQEFVADNGGTALKTMNRKVSAQGTKASGQTWTLDLQITLS